MSQIIIEIFTDIKNIVIRHPINGIMGLLAPFAMGYIYYDTYIDETVKQAVVIESDRIKNVIDDNCEIVYGNENRLVVFYADIIVTDKDYAKKVEQYLLKSGYQKRPSDGNSFSWKKGKFYIYENFKYNGETIFDVHYLKDSWIQ